MHRLPRVLATALAAGALLTSAACSAGGGPGRGAGTYAGAGDTRASGERRQAAPAAAAALSDAQAAHARLALDDLGSRWAPTEGAATWHDALLKGTAQDADCRRLLDGLYEDALLGEPSGGRAVVGFDDTENGAQLRHVVAAYDRSRLDASMEWLRGLPARCGEFTATDGQGVERAVQLVESPLPGLGDARQGLRMTVSGDVEQIPATLTLDIVAVRVGDSAFVLTDGGLYGTDEESTARAAERGTQRLKAVLADRAAGAPSTRRR
ncbi:hypothetical protein ACWERY_26995 [Streptomyces sp. NPDC004082]|jgi:hypothetical protein|uniref:hypothetical protein n=2 Tax=Streptomyces TaxID=1883 RepID=UPI0033BBCF9C